MSDAHDCATNPECFPELTAHELVKKHGSQREAARREGIPRSTLQDMLRAEARRGDIGGPPIPPIGRPPEGFAVHRNSAAYDADGALLKQWVGTKPDAGEVYAVPAGHTVKGESALVDPTGRVLAKWIKTREGAGEGLVEGLRAAFAEYEGKAPVIEAPPTAVDDLTVVYPIPDLHFGMRSWAAETSENYDVEIAKRDVTQAVDTLIATAMPASHAIIIMLGDTLHANDQKNVTPGSGHQLDVDGRYAATYLKCAQLIINIVEKAAAKHTKVTLVILPGNHDPEGAMTLSVALSLFYSANGRIEVYQKPGVFWYARFGACLFGANHGHTVKTPERMAMAMACDCASDWGQTKHRSIWTGHLHHEIMKEVPGVRVETLTSPAARDAWNHSSGFRSSRALSSITFHRDRGEIARNRVTISA